MKKAIIILAGISCFLLTIYEILSIFTQRSQQSYTQYQLIDTSYDLRQLQIKSLDVNFSQLFQKWMKIHNKKYNSINEYNYRFKVFIKNCEQIYTHNENAYYQYSLGLNKFSDITKQQFSALLGSFKYYKNINKQQIKHNYLNLNKQQLSTQTLQCKGTLIKFDPPQYIDWSKKYTNKVLDQGHCEASYAISVVQAVQAYYLLTSKRLQTFSVQQAIDCSGDYGNQGCYGGFMDQVLWYMIDNGVATQQSYPSVYNIDNSSKKCTYNQAMKTASFNKCADIPSGNYKELLSAVARQPTIAAIDGNWIQSHNQGLFTGNCSDTQPNLAVLIVGYGLDQNNQTYWKIKPSLGQIGKQEGYFKLQRIQQDGPGKCGIQLLASVPFIGN